MLMRNLVVCIQSNVDESAGSGAEMPASLSAGSSMSSISDLVFDSGDGTVGVGVRMRAHTHRRRPGDDTTAGALRRRI